MYFFVSYQTTSFSSIPFPLLDNPTKTPHATKTTSNNKQYVDSQWSQVDGTLGSLPMYDHDRIRSLENTGAYDSRQYQDIVEAFTSQFTIRSVPYPDCFLESFNTMNEEVYVGIQGESEFNIGGTLQTYYSRTANTIRCDRPSLKPCKMHSPRRRTFS